jgi:hypothetical protein
MESIREAIIIIALFTIAVWLTVPFYSIFALSSNPCPKYCDGCCVATKPKNATGLAEALSPTINNQKGLMRNNDN